MGREKVLPGRIIRSEEYKREESPKSRNLNHILDQIDEMLSIQKRIVDVLTSYSYNVKVDTDKLDREIDHEKFMDLISKDPIDL
jgi:hypothetical protein